MGAVQTHCITSAGESRGLGVSAELVFPCTAPPWGPALREASFQNTKANMLCLSARPAGFGAQNVKSWCVGTAQRLGKAASRPGPAGWAFKAFRWLSSAVGLAVLNFYFLCVCLSIEHLSLRWLEKKWLRQNRTRHVVIPGLEDYWWCVAASFLCVFSGLQHFLLWTRNAWGFKEKEEQTLWKVKQEWFHVSVR